MVSRSPITPQAVQSSTPPPQKSPDRDHASKWWVIGVLVLVMIFFASAHIVSTSYLMNHVPWGTKIDEVNVGGKTVASLKQSLPNQPIDYQLQIVSPNQTYQVDSNKLQISRNYNRVLDTINASLASPISAWRWWILSIKNPTTFQSPYIANEPGVKEVALDIAKQETIEGRLPKIELKQSGNAQSLTIDPGENGYWADEQQIQELIQFALSQRQSQVIIPLQSSLVSLNSVQTQQWLDQAKGLVGQSLTFTLPDQPIFYKLSDVQLVELLNPEPSSSKRQTSAESWNQIVVNQPLVNQVVQDWSKKVDRLPQNPVLDIDTDTLQVAQFVPPLDGLVINQSELTQLITTFINQNLGPATKSINNQTTISNLATNSGSQTTTGNLTTKDSETNPTLAATLPLPLTVQSPSVSLASTNSLGINEKIGHGQSRYAGSIATRIHNVSLATSRVNLIILKPGQEFRFNDQLGDVSSATGFKPAYIIRSGRTELGDGGGVCQVSTTLFRAALDAGLKITKRLPHSYRVSYYELDTKPGIDATVFSGDVDLRFINDTPGHILIFGQADPKTLTMYYDLYGTNDGRVSTITDHVTWAATPPLPPEYIYDPSLAPGQRKQIDWSAPGLKAKFTYTVVDRFGQELHKQTFTSNYRPWSAKFLVGTPPESS